MKLWKFDDYEAYLAAQVSGTERRMRRRQRAGIDQIETDCIVKIAPVSVKNILCHGSGNGVEVTLLKKAFPDATVLGTDLVEWGEETVKWDFNKPNPKWHDNIDLLYTNSLDHSPDPVNTLGVWFDQLSAAGLMVIQWNLNHVTMMKHNNIYVGGDCFMSHLDEFILFIDKVGEIKDVVFVGKSKKGGMRFLVSAEKRP